MSLYAIGDLHLSLGGSKPMDIFGEAWSGHDRKLRERFACVAEEDTVVLCGDLSWAMGLDDAAADFQFISELPGRKLIIKGNHDYWWQTAKKLGEWFAKNGWTNLAILHNSAALYDDGADGVALCGTRGWFFDEKNAGSAPGTAAAQNEKIYNREIMRLKTSLELGKKTGAARIFAFLHYPPLYGNGYECREIVELLADYRVEKCFYGHLHGPAIRLAEQGERYGVEFKLVSADGVDFSPVKIL